MARNNFSVKKRAKEMNRKMKQEKKRQNKEDKKSLKTDEMTEQPLADAGGEPESARPV